MAYADEKYLDTGKIAGCFYHKETDAFFEYLNEAPDWFMVPATKAGMIPTHTVFVNDFQNSQRAAVVKKTVVYVAVDEDDEGNTVWEKWSIKGHRDYIAERKKYNV